MGKAEGSAIVMATTDSKKQCTSSGS
jgi:hypothetical protein